MTSSLQAFRQAIDNSPQLQAQVLPLINQGGAANPELIKLGESLGYHFSETDLQEAINLASEDEELTDFELELVSGGFMGPSGTQDSNPSRNNPFQYR